MQQFALDGGKPALLQLAGRVVAGRSEAGRLSYRGTLGLNPLAARGTVEAVDLPLHALEPYFADALNVELLRADTSFKGTVRDVDSPAGPQLRVSGDTSIEDLRAHSMPVASAASAAPAAPAAPLAARATAQGRTATARAKPTAGANLGLAIRN